MILYKAKSLFLKKNLDEGLLMVYDQDGLHPFIMVARMAVCAMLASDKGPMVTPLSGLIVKYL